MRIDIQNALQLMIKKKGITGAALGFYDDGLIDYYLAGHSSASTRLPITHTTMFEIGSITKVFTTLLLSILVNQESMTLEDPIENFLQTIKLPEYLNHKISLKHLATHSSGLPTFPSTFIPKNYHNPYQNYRIEDLYYFLKNFKINQKPGINFEYSNLGLGLLAHILCLKCKKKYENIIQELILDPLTMSFSLACTNSSNINEMSMGHHIGRVVEHWDTPEPIIGSGGLRSNIIDMTKFLAANLQLERTSFAQALNICHNPILETDISNQRVGLGWMITHQDNDDIVWHDGLTGGFSNFIGFNKTSKKGLVILSNTRKPCIKEFAFSILNA